MMEFIDTLATEACDQLSHVDPKRIIEETRKNLFNDASIKDGYKAAIMSARTLIETEFNYTYVAARLLLREIYHEVSETLNLTLDFNQRNIPLFYSSAFKNFIHQGIQLELLHLEILVRSLDLVLTLLRKDYIMMTS